jgi:transaldolase
VTVQTETVPATDLDRLAVTLMFSIARYREVVEAYLGGLEDRAANGGELSPVASVASFFVSRVDTLIDPILGERVEAFDDQGIVRGQTVLEDLDRAPAAVVGPDPGRHRRGGGRRAARDRGRGQVRRQLPGHARHHRGQTSQGERMRAPVIVASVLGADYANLGQEVVQLEAAGVGSLHSDVEALRE